MSEEDQIIKINTEEQQVKKQKDPKKVAAGKALAKKNAEARKFFDESKTEVTEVTEEVPPVTFSYVNNIFIKVAGVVTSGFALYHGWKFFSSKQIGAEATKFFSSKQKGVEATQVKVEDLPKRKSIDF